MLKTKKLVENCVEPCQKYCVKFPNLKRLSARTPERSFTPQTRPRLQSQGDPNPTDASRQLPESDRSSPTDITPRHIPERVTEYPTSDITIEREPRKSRSKGHELTREENDQDFHTKIRDHVNTHVYREDEVENDEKKQNKPRQTRRLPQTVIKDEPLSSSDSFPQEDAFEKKRQQRRDARKKTEWNDDDE